MLVDDLKNTARPFSVRPSMHIFYLAKAFLKVFLSLKWLYKLGSFLFIPSHVKLCQD